MSKARLCTIALLCVAGTALAKLPPLADDAKAKAAEASAKTAWSDKVAAFQLCKAQDRVASKYMTDAKKAGKDVKPPAAAPACADPGPFVYTPAAAPGAAPATPAAAPAAAPPAPAKKS